MTYCIALRLHGGLVLLSDTRTNAGVDNISTYRKLHVLLAGDDRLFALQSAGSLATTHEVLDRIAHDLRRGAPESLATVESLAEAALYVGRLGLGDRPALTRRRCPAARRGRPSSSADRWARRTRTSCWSTRRATSSALLRTSRTCRSGESKYGKFMLDLAAHSETPITTATKIAVASMISTARANLSVGPPYDLGIYVPGAFVLHQFRIEADSELLSDLRELWERHVHLAVAEMPLVQIDLEPLG